MQSSNSKIKKIDDLILHYINLLRLRAQCIKFALEELVIPGFSSNRPIDYCSNSKWIIPSLLLHKNHCDSSSVASYATV
jgi:hypothetical protein